MAASHEGEITTGNPVSNTNIPQPTPVVNTQSMQGGEDYSQNALLGKEQWYIPLV